MKHVPLSSSHNSVLWARVLLPEEWLWCGAPSRGRELCHPHRPPDQGLHHHHWDHGKENSLSWDSIHVTHSLLMTVWARNYSLLITIVRGSVWCYLQQIYISGLLTHNFKPVHHVCRILKCELYTEKTGQMSLNVPSWTWEIHYCTFNVVISAWRYYSLYRQIVAWFSWVLCFSTVSRPLTLHQASPSCLQCQWTICHISIDGKPGKMILYIVTF